jgi:hypothetical protein
MDDASRLIAEITCCDAETAVAAVSALAEVRRDGEAETIGAAAGVLRWARHCESHLVCILGRQATD